MRNTNNLAKNQRGFVSLVVALTLIIILALVTVGFAQLSRREQRQALNKQLTVQAYYASESGINDVRQALSGATPTITTSTPGADGTSCLSNSDLPHSAINNFTGVAYTCVLLNLTPPSLFYQVGPSGNGASDNRTATFSTDTPLSSLTIQWDSPNNNNHLPGVSANSEFQPSTTWSGHNYASVIEFTIAPIGNTFDQDTLISKSRTFYFYPASAGTNSVNYNSSGSVVSGNCNPNCSAIITSIPNSSTDPSITQYYIHFRVIYTDANITITGVNSSNGQVKFIGGQALIDSTGKAQDVLKRLQVRMPLNAQNQPVSDDFILPNFAIESQDTCKHFKTDPSTTDYFDLSGGGPLAPNSSDPCNLVN